MSPSKHEKPSGFSMRTVIPKMCSKISCIKKIEKLPVYISMSWLTKSILQLEICACLLAASDAFNI
jgi:hypothetical protein